MVLKASPNTPTAPIFIVVVLLLLSSVVIVPTPPPSVPEGMKEHEVPEVQVWVLAWAVPALMTSIPLTATAASKAFLATTIIRVLFRSFYSRAVCE
jgi:hypothetical protein